MIELYQFEQCPHSQSVRMVLSELGLDYICRNAPPWRPEKDQPLIALSGSRKVPFLIDPDKGVSFNDEESIIDYLMKTYGR